MNTLATKFNGKLAVSSIEGDLNVSNFFKQDATTHNSIVTQSLRKFWKCVNNGVNVHLVFNNDEKSFLDMFDNFDGNGYRCQVISKQFQYLG